MNIAEGLASLTAQKFEDDGVAVTYSRGATNLALTAVQGRTTWEGDNAEGVTVLMESPDWFVKAGDLGALGQPAAGDRITTATAVYEVCAPEGGQNVFQWADGPNRAVYRVHTKQMGEP